MIFYLNFKRVRISLKPCKNEIALKENAYKMQNCLDNNDMQQNWPIRKILWLFHKCTQLYFTIQNGSKKNKLIWFYLFIFVQNTTNCHHGR